MSDRHLLIVDDEPDSAEVAAMMLASAHIATTIVHDAYEAITLLEAQPDGYRGVLVDLAMPGMDGFALLRQLRAQALKAGFNAYFPKPLDTSVFLGMLERMLTRDA